jgi:hypothetical protein
MFVLLQNETISAGTHCWAQGMEGWRRHPTAHESGGHWPGSSQRVRSRHHAAQRAPPHRRLLPLCGRILLRRPPDAPRQTDASSARCLASNRCVVRPLPRVKQMRRPAAATRQTGRRLAVAPRQTGALSAPRHRCVVRSLQHVKQVRRLAVAPRQTGASSAPRHRCVVRSLQRVKQVRRLTVAPRQTGASSAPPALRQTGVSSGRCHASNRCVVWPLPRDRVK